MTEVFEIQAYADASMPTLPSINNNTLYQILDKPIRMGACRRKLNFFFLSILITAKVMHLPCVFLQYLISASMAIFCCLLKLKRNCLQYRAYAPELIHTHTDTRSVE